MDDIEVEDSSGEDEEMEERLSEGCKGELLSEDEDEEEEVCDE